MPLIILLFTLVLAGFAMSTNEVMKTVQRNGMTVQWQLTETELKIWMSAPTKGWVAVGLNFDDQLAGTSLMMGRIQDGSPEVKDFYIIAPGQYQSVVDLGGTSLVRNVEGREAGTGTELHFSLPIQADSEFHHILQAGAKVHLLMAYSRSDDFEHHSMMRTSVPIEL
ncbi:MAG: DOMON domain-containing protein [Bacteroidota bacterium]